jgi:hypothetical protein
MTCIGGSPDRINPVGGRTRQDVKSWCCDPQPRQASGLQKKQQRKI